MSEARRLRWFGGIALVVTLAFSLPLYQVARFSFKSDLHSHALLIPFISGYLVWTRRQSIPREFTPAWGLATLAALGSMSFLAGGWIVRGLQADKFLPAWLPYLTLAYAGLLLAAGFAVLGGRVMRAVAFPAAFLVFLTPLPPVVVDALERWLQHASAEAANLLFLLSTQTYVRDGLVFRLPGVTIEVAPECSGIRSSLVLFITSLLAGWLFLARFRNRAFLALSVIPLGILRNAFRIFIIGTLTAYVDPGIIRSPLHHRGGPLFFVLSLVPFFGLLWLFRRSEKGKTTDQGL